MLLCDRPDVGHKGCVFTLEGGKLEAGTTVLVIQEICDVPREILVAVSSFAPLAEDSLDGGHGRIHVRKLGGREARRSVYEIVGNDETVPRGHGLDFVGYVRVPGQG